MWRAFLANWYFLIPILSLSVASLTIAIERIIYFKNRIIEESDMALLVENIRKKNNFELNALTEDQHIPEKKLVRMGFRLLNKQSREKLTDILSRHTDQVLGKFDRNLPFLSGIANVATLLGLFGTVTGMIIVFFRMKESGSSDIQFLAGGISQALITTAAGLFTAIPAYFFDSLLYGWLEQKEKNMHNLIYEISILAGHRSSN